MVTRQSFAVKINPNSTTPSVNKKTDQRQRNFERPFSIFAKFEKRKGSASASAKHWLPLLARTARLLGAGGGIERLAMIAACSGTRRAMPRFNWTKKKHTEKKVLFCFLFVGEV